MAIWAVCKDPGGTAGLLPVVRMLRATHTVILIANGKAVDILRAANERFVAHDSAEEVLAEYPLPQVLLTSMCTQGGVGRDLIPHLRGYCPIVMLRDFWTSSFEYWSDPAHRPDRVCVNDRLDADIVLEAWPGFSRSRIERTGYPMLDQYSRYDVGAAVHRIRSRFSMEQPKPIVFFGCGILRQASELLSEVISVLNRMGDVYFLPRYHPRMPDEAPQEVGLWEKTLTTFERGTLIPDVQTHNIQELIAAATVVLSDYSTVLMEAAALRKPNVSILYPRVGMAQFLAQCGNLMDEFPLVELGCSAKAANRQELFSLLSRGVEGCLGLKAAQEEHIRPDGKNAIRVARFVDSLLVT